jgi:nitrite reductase/ring-hydroxylating ferredoxin subunit
MTSASEMFICNLEELKSSKSIIRFSEALKDELVLFLDSNNQVTCYSSVCPHLAGEVIRDDSGHLRCKWHGLEFDSKGASKNCKARLQLRNYETVVRAESVYVKYEP